MKKLLIITALTTALFANEYTCDAYVQSAALSSKKAREYHYMQMMPESCYENRKALSMALSAKGECGIFGITKYDNNLNGLIEQLNINYGRFCK